MGERETVAYVALSHAAYSFDNEYSYLVPERYRHILKAGMRVLVSFGRGNNRVIGLVTRIGTDDISQHRLKPIISVVDTESLVSDEMMKIIFWLKENTFCTYYDAFKSAVPTGFSYKVDMHFALVNTYIDRDTLTPEESEIISFLEGCDEAAEIDKYFDLKANPERKKPLDTLIDKGLVEEVPSFKRKVGDDSVKMAVLMDGYEDADLTPKQKKVVELLEESGSASVKELCYMTGCTSTIIKRLCEKDVIRVYEQEVMRNAVGEFTVRESPEDIVLNDEQKMAYNGIMNLIHTEKPAGALLYGVTGSGKTSVFIKVIDSVIKMGKTAIMLVPEISLTPQMLARFKVLFGENIALLHSSLSLGQRMDEFKRIKRGEARIIIGTRSAVFAPAENIGVIIMDEEGEQSYKSDSNPRYHARDVAIQRCGHNGALLLMASATPSLETFYHAQKGRFHLFTLAHRYSDAVLPKVEIIDMQTEAAEGNDSLISRKLADELTETLQRNEQAILLLNRRGFSTYVSCGNCRQPVVCPKCNIPLTYHKKNNRFMCHYCGYTMDNLAVCPSCGSDKLRSSGVGTQRVEDELARIYPDVRILRMDADTTSSRYAYEEKFKAFENHEYDIMLGTQMIAKGLNFPNVTLVGVISLDKALFTGDFRSYERTFSLLTQVAGRSGRGSKPGSAYIQTFVPDHYVLNLAAEQNYDEFYAEEIALRQSLIYPPCCDICVIGFSAVMESRAIAASDHVTAFIAEYLRTNKVDFPLRAIGPAPCTLEVINGRYRYRLILKSKNTRCFRQMIKSVLKDFNDNKDFREVRIYADINGDIGL
ncbi:primosomal protein N' [Ruminococcus sp.]|uniref:replication restart helicase PriA n=1 Tax=Ruminococcus sp. TaxID=41978 RepID=UPI00258AF9B3|nr:primosomal protein N' [Ruminococcus sp.]MCR5022391.1 primosomal protein N' [Ruminococcus sp.]